LLKKNKKTQIELFILNYNGENILKKCVDSFKNSLDNFSDITLIDNGSKDNSVKIIKKYPFNKIVMNKNRGFSGGFNYGIKSRNSRAEWYCLISNDVLCLNEDFLNIFRKESSNLKKVGVIGCELILPDDKIQMTGCNLKFNGFTQPYLTYVKSRKPTFEVDMICGAIFFIKRSVWGALGGFDEIFRPYFSEETDLCMRTKKLGHKVFKSKKLVFRHNHGQTIKKDNWGTSFVVSRKNIGTFKLLHYPLFWLPFSFILEIKSFLNCFIVRDEKGNLKTAENKKERVKLFLKAHSQILKQLPLIIKKRFF